MNVITLHRIDSPKGMHRFYRLDVQPDLFGQMVRLREQMFCVSRSEYRL
jgi:hypothetical protein